MDDWYTEGFSDATCPECDKSMDLRSFKYGQAFECEGCDVRQPGQRAGRQIDFQVRSFTTAQIVY